MLTRNLKALELKLSKHQKRIESFNEMKQQVKKNEKYMRKALDTKDKENIEIEDRKNVQDGEDGDLILEECDKEESDSEDEGDEETENDIQYTKVI